MNLYETIFIRKSVRKYKMEQINPKILEEIKAFSQDITGLFSGIKTEFSIIDNVNGQHKLTGLFGVKAPYYLAIYSEIKDKYLMNAGYLMEQMGLYLCNRGFGTCYLGSSNIRGKVHLIEDKKLVILLAFGKSKGICTRKPAEAKRIPLKDLCVYKEVPRQWMKQLLDAARLAPSSMNSQPWRFVVYDNRIHIFAKKHTIDHMGKWDEFNFGILFSHIMIVAEELWLDVDLIRLEDISQKTFANSEYILSAILRS